MYEQIDEWIKHNKTQQQAEEKSGFYDLEPYEEHCGHPEHEFPMHLNIPPGKGYKHVCPSCGKVTKISNPIFHYG